MQEHHAWMPQQPGPAQQAHQHPGPGPGRGPHRQRPPQQMGQPGQAQPDGTEQQVTWLELDHGNSSYYDDNADGARRGPFPCGPNGASPGHQLNPVALAPHPRPAMYQDPMHRQQVGHDPTPPMQQGSHQGSHPSMAGAPHPLHNLQPGGMQQQRTTPAAGDIHFHMDDSTGLHHDPVRWASHTQASMEGVLSCEQAYELLVEDSFQPGHRTPLIRKNSQGLHQPLFKECPKRRLKGEPGADRWRNSGGEKGSSFLRNKEGVQVIRRRYGTVSQANGTKLKYHEYNLVNQDSGTGKLADSKGCTLFHLLPEMRTGPDPRDGSKLSPATSANGVKRGYSETDPAGGEGLGHGGGTGRGATKAQRRKQESKVSPVPTQPGLSDAASWGSAGAGAGAGAGAPGQFAPINDDPGRNSARLATENHDWGQVPSQVAQTMRYEQRQNADPNHQLLARNFPGDITIDQIRGYFRQFGKLEDVQITFRHGGPGTALITYDTSESVQKAVEAFKEVLEQSNAAGSEPEINDLRMTCD